MNIHTLKQIVEHRKDVPLFIPNFKDGDMPDTLSGLGFTNITILPFSTWHQLDQETYMMILPDHAGRHDSGLLFDHQGYRILSTVDCGNCCDGNLPQDVDVLLSSFAGGASGFPVCWEEMYSKKEIKFYVEKNRKTIVKNFYDKVLQSKAKSIIPYAGYFTEAHPTDQSIHDINPKNSAKDVADYMKKLMPEIIVHSPFPGDFFDLSTLRNDQEFNESLFAEESWDFKKYDALIYAEPLTADELKQYFSDLEFKSDLLLHIQEYDDHFKVYNREYFVNFSQSTSPVTEIRPKDFKGNYLRIKVRQGIFSYMLREKMPWEEMSIGFQGRFYREPDTYNFTFWNHVQNHIKQNKRI